MMSWAKNLLVGCFAAPWLPQLLAATRGPLAVVIMMHRFQRPDGRRAGHDPAQLRRILASLRRAGIELVDLDTVIGRFRDSAQSGAASAKRGLSVAFTIDDGYADAYSISAPVFAEFDCPVTNFVVPQVVDGTLWFWWDKIDYILRETPRKRLVVENSGKPLAMDLADPASRPAAHERICDLIKIIPATEVDGFLSTLAHTAEVSLPERAPEEDAVLSWDAMRRAEASGWRFGAHTVTHPILSRCADDQARWEVAESVRRLSSELKNPSRVFCYPVGRSQDFGPRDQRAVRDAGLDMAVSAVPGLLRHGMEQTWGKDWSLTVPRVSYDERLGGIQRLFL